MNTEFDEQRDLQVSRIINCARANIWRAWAEPALLVKWWAPAPIVTTVQEYEFRSGGAFRSTMRMEDGSEYPSNGCFLEVTPKQRIVFTDTLEAGWRPAQQPFFSAIITLEDQGEGIVYSARALHRNAEDRQKHADMGFEQGWTMVMNQLARVAGDLQDQA